LVGAVERILKHTTPRKYAVLRELTDASIKLAAMHGKTVSGAMDFNDDEDTTFEDTKEIIALAIRAAATRRN
jgi:hypothetical protein